MKDLNQVQTNQNMKNNGQINMLGKNNLKEATKRKGTLDSFVVKKPRIGSENQDDSTNDLNMSDLIVNKKKCSNPFDSSDSESGNSEYEAETEDICLDASIILDYLNNSSFEDLLQISGCSELKAQKILDGRPYNNMKELKSNKIITEKIIDGCREILLIKQNLSKLLRKCEAISANLTKRIKPFINSNEMNSTMPEDGISEQPMSLTKGLLLKNYQLVGINWLRIVHEENLNGILADEMGLGKTIQTIAFLSYLFDNNVKGPHIIIVPTSTLNNWERELQKWCPQLNKFVYHGNQEERRQMRYELLGKKDLHVLLTTYQISISHKDDRMFIKKMNFHYGIFDEAHVLKNMLSMRYQYLSNFKIKRKLLLTGTPLQNNLLELISLLSFVMPAMFLTSNDGLKKIFQVSNKSSQKQSTFNEEKIRQIKDMLAPFCLRRLKSQVLSQMPTKTVDIVRLPLNQDQNRLYTNFVDLTKRVKNDETNRISAMAAIMELRKIGNHTLLVKNIYTDEILRKMSRDMLLDEDHITANQQLIFEDLSAMHDFKIHQQCLQYPHAIGKYRLDNDMLLNSNKIQYLDENLPKFIANGDRILIFSQFMITLDIIAEFLKYRSFLYLRLDGSTSIDDRQEYIDDFNENDEVKIFLLTTRAGGLGINLTSANVVILHDIDYNPYNDRQAEDRSHRIGQLRDVRVIKMISEDTIDECILHISTEKLKLEQVTISDDADDDETKSSSSSTKDVDFASLLQQAIDRGM